MFLVILGYAVWQNLDIHCGCFTADELDAQQSVKTALWRDLIMIGATFFSTGGGGVDHPKAAGSEN